MAETHWPRRRLTGMRRDEWGTACGLGQTGPPEARARYAMSDNPAEVSCRKCRRIGGLDDSCSVTEEGDPVLPFARIANALDVPRLHWRGQDPQWVIDQMVRALTGSDEDGPGTAEYREFMETVEP